jgi:hypothetical protein
VSLFFFTAKEVVCALRARDICFAGDIAFGGDTFPAGRFMSILLPENLRIRGSLV